MEGSETPDAVSAYDRRVKAAMVVCDLLATALHEGPTDLVSVELRRAYLIVARLLRELGVTDEMPDR